MSLNKIIICGSTGNQGMAVARQLLSENKWQVIALTRDPGSQAAQTLRGLGAAVVKADTNSMSSLTEAFQGAYGIFAVTQPWSAEKAGFNITSELIQGKNILWGAREAGVAHLVFSSFINPAGNLTGVDFIDSKRRLEQMIRQSELSYTILRCAIYLDNIQFPVYGENIFRGNYDRDTKIPYIALADIGKAVSQIFNNAAQFRGQQFDLAGDLISGNEIAALLRDIYDRQILYSPYPAFKQLFLQPEIYRLRKYFRNLNNSSDLSLLLTAMNKAKDTFGDLTTVASRIADPEFISDKRS